jgi:hypothetical protein
MTGYTKLLHAVRLDTNRFIAAEKLHAISPEMDLRDRTHSAATQQIPDRN